MRIHGVLTKEAFRAALLYRCSNISVCFLLGTLPQLVTFCCSPYRLFHLSLLESQKDVQPTVTLCDKKTTTFNHDFMHLADVDEFFTPLLLW